MQTLIHQLASPISRRLATMVGTYLTTVGVASDQVTTLVAAVPVLVGLLVDVALSNLNKRSK